MRIQQGCYAWPGRFRYARPGTYCGGPSVSNHGAAGIAAMTPSYHELVICLLLEGILHHKSPLIGEGFCITLSCPPFVVILDGTVPSYSF